MKKSVIVGMMVLVGVTASAVDMWNYAMQLSVVPQLASEPGVGSGWYVGLFNNADDTLLGSTTVAANNMGNLYVLGWNTPLINEGTDVYMAIFNNAVKSSAVWAIESQVKTLQDLNAPWSPPAANVSMSFAGSSWQAVPEPATALLFGIGGMGAWVLRRSKIKSQEEGEEADA